MKNFREIEGDLIEMFKNGDLDIIAHGCNCFASFGAGIALTIGNEFPETKLADKNQSTPEGMKRLGKLTVAPIDGIDGYVYNLYTQYNPGRDFRMSALKKALKLMRKDIEKRVHSDLHDTIKIGFPLIGCGIAGGNWDEVREVILKEFKGFDLTFVHFTKKVIGVNYWPRRVKKLNLKKSK